MPSKWAQCILDFCLIVWSVLNVWMHLENLQSPAKYLSGNLLVGPLPLSSMLFTLHEVAIAHLQHCWGGERAAYSCHANSYCPQNT